MESLTLINAQIITMDPDQDSASGMVIQDGKISHLLFGTEGNNPPGAGKSLDLKGRFLMPGLIDSHLHLRNYAESLDKIDCETDTKRECLDRVKKRVADTPPGSWILGHGWNHNNWLNGYGSAAELDQAAPNHPVYLTGKSLHVSWANSKALSLAGIHNGILDPPGGALQRDEKGNPTGILFEDAVKLIEGLIPVPDLEETARIINQAQKSLWRMGLTGVHDFDRELCIFALQSLVKQDLLRLRVVKSIPSTYLSKAIEKGYRTGAGNDWIWFGGVKEFMDGALGPQTGAMLAPYEGTDLLGMLLKTEDEIFELGQHAANNGLALSIHAIGDLANRTLLNALERLRRYEKENGIQPLPHRIEHVQLIDPEDISRLAELGIIASMQPIHATSDMEMADLYWGERTASAYAPGLQLAQGAQLIFGSDAPVESPNPWWGIHAAVTRRRANGFPGPDGWRPENRISIQQALNAYTLAPAKATGRSNIQGKIKPGYWADLIVLEADPRNCPADDLRDILPVGTMVNGEWVYRNF